VLAEVRYQVFVSSTYEDLRVERQQATQAILETNHMPAGMELFPASDLSQWELIKSVINESDYYVVIVAAKYGSIHNQTGLSFTEMEYDYAVSTSIPILGFVRKNISEISSKHSELDPEKREKLERFRAKVMSRICRQFDDPNELGMLVMKSLLNEMRTNPRTGWVRADQARGLEDIEREQALAEDLKEQQRHIRRLERKIRDQSLPLVGISLEQMSQGDDLYPLKVSFQDASKKPISIDVPMTWNEIFSVIGPTMYGYMMRRAPPGFNDLVGQYPFEAGLIEYVRAKIIDRCGLRKLSFMPHQIDTILIQFKQLGLVALNEKTKDEDGEELRGYQLTVIGEENLTRLKLQLQ
jgi:hypothetical protein